MGHAKLANSSSIFWVSPALVLLPVVPRAHRPHSFKPSGIWVEMDQGTVAHRSFTQSTTSRRSGRSPLYGLRYSLSWFRRYYGKCQSSHPNLFWSELRERPLFFNNSPLMMVDRHFSLRPRGRWFVL